jgi:hypothetical protein
MKLFLRRRLPELVRAGLFFVAVAVCSTAMALSCTSCKTTGGPGPVKTVISDVVDCTKDAVRETALHILDDAASALATGGWQDALLDLAQRFGGDALSCALEKIRGDAIRFNRTVGTPDELEALKAERATRWLNDNHVVFAGADGGPL